MARYFREQLTEKYYCPHCNDFRSFLDIYQNWQCPACHHKVRIRLEINGFFHACYRVNPGQLNVGDTVTLENEHLHDVLNIQKTGDQYRIALKNYTVMNFDCHDLLTKIDGKWSLDTDKLI